MTMKKTIREEIKEVLLSEVPEGAMYREVTIDKQIEKLLERFEIRRRKGHVKI